ncbi:MAG: hypothetical protein JJE21_02560 [Spirochaetaceae bacterium]|nr:hypothetical protein [Spirochaetaceae bacterium]
MKDLEYQIQINKFINSLSVEKLREKLLSIAYSIPFDKREEFIKYFEDADYPSTKESKEEITLISDGFEKALIFLDEVTNQEIYLNRVYTRDDKDEEDSSHLEDPYSIEEMMHGVFILVDRLLDAKEYSKALAIYSKLKDLNIFVNDDEYEMFSFSLEEYYCDSTKYEENISYVGTRALYCLYSIPGPLDIKAIKFNDYLNSPLCRSVDATEFLNNCRNNAEHLEEFLVVLMNQLFITPGQKSIEWLSTIAPINIIENNLEASSKKHPRLHRILMSKYINAKLYNEALDVGVKALLTLDTTLVERAKVANLLISISLYKRGLIEESSINIYYYSTSTFKLNPKEQDFLWERFVSKSSLNNLLSLYKSICEDEIKLISLNEFLHEKKLNLVNEDEDTELITNIVTRDVETLGLFLTNQNEESYQLLVSRYTTYDREYKNCMLNIFLLFFIQEKSSAEYLTQLAPDTRDVGYDKDLYVGILLNLTNNLKLKLIKWMSEVCFNSVDKILENKEEQYYQRSVKIIKALNTILKENNLDFKKTDIISYYSNKYYNYNKFRVALD